MSAFSFVRLARPASFAAAAFAVIAPAAQAQYRTVTDPAGYGSTAVYEFNGRVDQEIRLQLRDDRAVVQRVGPREVGIGSSSRLLSAIPRQNGQLTIERLAGRGRMDVIQQPTASNGYSAVVRLVDGEAGAANYHFVAYWQPVGGRGGNGRNGGYGRTGTGPYDGRSSGGNGGYDDRNGGSNGGYGRDGYDADGWNRDGYGRDGYDRNGYDRGGFDRRGYDRNGYDRNGRNRNGSYRASQPGNNGNGHAYGHDKNRDKRDDRRDQRDDRKDRRDDRKDKHDDQHDDHDDRDGRGRP